MTTLTLYSHCPHCDFPRDRARPFEYACGSSDFGNRSRECELRTEVDRLTAELQETKRRLEPLAAKQK